MKALFKNPKMAAAYVGITMFSVWLFIGTEDAPGSLQQTVDTFSDAQSTGQSQRQFGASVAAKDGGATPAKEQVVVEFLTDEELIDGAEGFDPTPDEDFSGYDPDPDSRPYLSDQDKRKAQDAEDIGGWASDE